MDTGPVAVGEALEIEVFAPIGLVDVLAPERLVEEEVDVTAEEFEFLPYMLSLDCR